MVHIGGTPIRYFYEKNHLLGTGERETRRRSNPEVSTVFPQEGKLTDFLGVGRVRHYFRFAFSLA